MEISSFLIGMILSFTRIAAFLFTIPFLKPSTIPSIAKIAVSLGIAMSVAQHVGEQVVVSNVVEFILLIMMQLMAGLTLGYIVQLIFAVMNIAGGLIDIDLGFSMMQVMDPASNQQVTVIANFFYILFGIIFVSLGGLEQIVLGVVYSFKIIEPSFFLGELNFLEQILAIFGFMLTSGVQIAVVITVTIFILNFVILILGKSAPQINIFANMFGIKIVTGLFLLYIMLPFLHMAMTQLTEGMFDHYLDVIEFFK